jgi:hypothetical protein
VSSKTVEALKGRQTTVAFRGSLARTGAIVSEGPVPANGS